MSEPLTVEPRFADPHTASAALLALAEEDGATWILCDPSGQALLVGAGAAARLAALPGGDALVWDALAAAIRAASAGFGRGFGVPRPRLVGQAQPFGAER
jgi:hypothetical protein